MATSPPAGRDSESAANFKPRGRWDARRYPCSGVSWCSETERYGAKDPAAWQSCLRRSLARVACILNPANTLGDFPLFFRLSITLTPAASI